MTPGQQKDENAERYLAATIQQFRDEVRRLAMALREARNENDELKAALEAVLLFFSGPPWDNAKALRWFNITQDPDCTSKKLCDHVRAAMEKTQIAREAFADLIDGHPAEDGGP